MAEEHKRDGWDKLGLLLQPLGGLLTALAIAFLGIYSSGKISVGQEKETRARLYIELMSKREESESALRKDMFKSIMDAFLSPTAKEMDAKLLKLELLTYNFHESLNLKPLFMDLQRQIDREAVSGSPERAQLLDRLNRAAKEISRKQTAVLKGGGEALSHTIEFDPSGNANRNLVYEDTLALGGITRQFSIRVLKTNQDMKEMEVFLTVNTLRKITQNHTSEKLENLSASFMVGFFDFPMIDNMRLSEDQRCAIVLREFKKTSADITLVYFPGSHASIKEKPYYQEVLDKLTEENKER
jgi:hypothetical protein